MSPVLVEKKRREEAEALADRISRIEGVKGCDIFRADGFGRYVLKATLDLPISNGYCVPDKGFSLIKLTNKIRRFLDGYKSKVHSPRRSYMQFYGGSSRLFGYPGGGLFQIDLQV